MRHIAINCISELIYQSTWNQKAYDGRLKGFLAESLAPTNLVSAKGYKPLKGGLIFPLEEKKDLEIRIRYCI